jgi:hypothetical protein
MSKNHRTTVVKLTAELKNHLEDPFPQKQSNERFKNPTSMLELELLNL